MIHTEPTALARPQLVTGRLVWLIRRGDLILPDEPIVSRFDLECNLTSKYLKLGKSTRIIFVASAIDNPPSTLAELPQGTVPHYIRSSSSNTHFL